MQVTELSQQNTGGVNCRGVRSVRNIPCPEGDNLGATRPSPRERSGNGSRTLLTPDLKSRNDQVFDTDALMLHDIRATLYILSDCNRRASSSCYPFSNPRLLVLATTISLLSCYPPTNFRPADRIHGTIAMSIAI